jgi:hypothetical protein
VAPKLRDVRDVLDLYVSLAYDRCKTDAPPGAL